MEMLRYTKMVTEFEGTTIATEGGIGGVLVFVGKGQHSRSVPGVYLNALEATEAGRAFLSRTPSRR